jgi:hypothetical protein
MLNSLGKVTNKNVTFGVTKVTPQSKKKKEYKKHNSLKSVNTLILFKLFISLKRFLLEIVTKKSLSQEGQKPRGFLKKRKEEKKNLVKGNVLAALSEALRRIRRVESIGACQSKIHKVWIVLATRR